MLHGRRSECDALVRLLADAGRSRSVVLLYEDMRARDPEYAGWER
jgi:hypothetical protein